MLDAVRVLTGIATTLLLAAVIVSTFTYVRLPRERRLLPAWVAVALASSYGSLLVCAVALEGDLARSDAAFRWYATPLLIAALAAGWATVIGMRSVGRRR